MIRKTILALLLLFPWLGLTALAWPALPRQPVEVEVSADFTGGRDTVIYVEDLETGLVYSLQGRRIDERHPPFSTFKIPNFLIALETGAVADVDEVIPYSAERRPAQAWWPSDWPQDQTLVSAFRRSAAWAFQDIALRVGSRKYEGYLKHFAYGNEAHEGDAFWLDGSLQISPKEQVDFLRKLLTKQFEIAPTNLEALRRAAFQKKLYGFRYYGKTGAGPVKDGDWNGPFEGWFVGWLERPEAPPVVFALWTRGPSFESIKDYRSQACQDFLEQLGFLPLEW